MFARPTLNGKSCIIAANRLSDVAELFDLDRQRERH
jgi:hypothetical protein